MKKYSATILLAATMLALAACGGGTSGESGSEGNGEDAPTRTIE